MDTAAGPSSVTLIYGPRASAYTNASGFPVVKISTVFPSANSPPILPSRETSVPGFPHRRQASITSAGSRTDFPDGVTRIYCSPSRAVLSTVISVFPAQNVRLVYRPSQLREPGLSP